MNTITRLIPVSFLALAACGLLAIDFAGTVSVPFEVTPDEDRFDGIVTVDLTENQDYQDNKDKISGGKLIAIEAEIVEVYPNNAADAGSGYLYAGPAGVELVDDGVEASLAKFDENQLFVGQIIPFDMTDDQKQYVTSLLFPEDGADPRIDVLVRVDANGVPAFRAKLNVDVEFTAGL